MVGLKKKEFDPLAYIENAFLDTKAAHVGQDGAEDDLEIPSIGKFLNGEVKRPQEASKKSEKFRKTTMSAPRPRRRTAPVKKGPSIDPELQVLWEALPKNVEFLMGFFDDSVTANYYRGEFKESRGQLLRRILDPELTLEETSRLLGVCPATVRRYTNRKWLMHHRTQGGQRRFRLSDIVRFVEAHGRFPEE